MSSDLVSLGRRVAGLRAGKGFTQRELAEAARISVPFLSGIENGKRNASSEVIIRIADALDASLDHLLRGTQDEPAAPESGPVPHALHAAAERLGWTYANVQALLRAYRAVIATRGATLREWSESDWVRLYDQFFDE